MPAAETAQIDPPGLPALRRRLGRTAAPHIDVESAGATEIELSPQFGIQVEHQASGERIGRQPMGASHPGLFVNGEQRFERPVLEADVLEDRQNQGHADAVVGPSVVPPATSQPSRRTGRIGSREKSCGVSVLF